MKLPAQLKANRERLGLSQEEVAMKIFVSRQTISNWETGKTYPDVQSLLLLSNLFGVSIDSLVKGDVEIMEKNIEKDAKILKYLSWGMIAFMVAAVASGGCAIIMRDFGEAAYYGVSAACLVFLGLMAIFFLCAFALAVWAEVLKKQNDLVTFREIVAFEKGQSLDEIRDESSFSRKHPVMSGILKVCSGALFAIIALIVFIAIAKMIRDLLFMGIV